MLASLCAAGQRENIIFQLEHPTNRDNCYYPYWLLKKKLSEIGIEINTADVNIGKCVDLEIHQDVQRIADGIPSYVMLLESPAIRPEDQHASLLVKYRKIFTWNDDLVDGLRYIKLNTPNHIIVDSALGWQSRDRLCCLIAGNKSVRQGTSLELYSERVKTIRWFEKYAPSDFDLFGIGWDAPAARCGKTGRVLDKLHKLLLARAGKVYFPSYRGKVSSKLSTLQQYRFSICYENARDYPGYITEKIFDSFFAGCVPVYWGASNVNSHIPTDCFIDRRQFDSHEELYRYMTTMTESEYVVYQERIAAFLTSNMAKPFSAECFADTVCSTIKMDLVDIM